MLYKIILPNLTYFEAIGKTFHQAQTPSFPIIRLHAMCMHKLHIINKYCTMYCIFGLAHAQNYFISSRFKYLKTSLKNVW